MAPPRLEVCKRGHNLAETRLYRKDGRRSYCGACHIIRVKEYAKKNPRQLSITRRKSQLKAKYGIDIRQYEKLLAAQGGRCAICGTTDFGSKGPMIDHCHTNQHVRGILCMSCNVALGLFKDDTIRMRSAIQYLKRKGRRP